MPKAIFWDLQGTLGGDAAGDVTAFTPYPFAKEAMQLARSHGFLNIVITNQSRIGKGLLLQEDFDRTKAAILAFFNADDVLLHDFLCCPHQNSDNCSCKKPRTGLVDLCAARYHLHLPDCFVIGDMGKNEIVLAHNAGCKGILVLTGGGKDSLGTFRSAWADHEADLIAENALEAVRALLA